MGLLSYLPAIFTVLFSLLPSDYYSIAGDFHRAIFVIYLAIVTERFSQYQPAIVTGANFEKSTHQC